MEIKKQQHVSGAPDHITPMFCTYQSDNRFFFFFYYFYFITRKMIKKLKPD